MLNFSRKLQKQETNAKTRNPEKTSIRVLVDNYCHFETQCSKTTDKLERKAKDILIRIENEVPSKADKVFFGRKDEGADISHPSAFLNTNQFKRRAELARRFCIPYRIMSGNTFIQGATEEELQELEDLEVQIQLQQFHIQNIENDILDSNPETPEDAISKLKFVATLLIDGCHIDTDYFAFLVQESANQIDTSLDEILRTYRRHEATIM